MYVQGSDAEALRLAISNINQIIDRERARSSTVQIIVAGDFDRHDNLWGGITASDMRQGEAEPIIEMMGLHGLSSC